MDPKHITKITIMVNGQGKRHIAEFDRDGRFLKGDLEMAATGLELVARGSGAEIQAALDERGPLDGPPPAAPAATPGDDFVIAGQLGPE